MRGLATRAGLPADRCPVADGGEGTAELLRGALGGELRSASASDPLGRERQAAYVLLADGRAVVEVAAASGLHAIAEHERDPERASSAGTGELIAAAIAQGASTVLVAAGGSASTDGGAGAIAALRSSGGLRGARITVLCDVRTPFERAAAVFAPQKGADPHAVERLERRLEALAAPPRGVPMSGAAGGLAGGLWHRLGAVLVAGAAYVLDALDFDARMVASAAVVVGEGRLDRDQPRRARSPARSRPEHARPAFLLTRSSARARSTASMPASSIYRRSSRPATRRTSRRQASRSPRDLSSAPATLARVSTEQVREPTASGTARRLSRAQASLPGTRRATVIGAGSFGTALAVLLARGGLRTTLQTRTDSQAATLAQTRTNETYLPGVELPAPLRIESVASGVARADYVFLAVPSTSLAEAIETLPRRPASATAPRWCRSRKASCRRTAQAPTTLLRARFGAHRVACIGGPAHAQEMVHAGAGLVAAAFDEGLAEGLAVIFTRAGVVCEHTNDPVGVELAGVAKNAAALAAGATEAQGLNAAGAAAGHIFAEVWRFAEARGARPESFIGLAGAGDLVATALAPMSRNRRAGELLAQGMPAAEIQLRVAQAVEALQSVPLLARAIEHAGLAAPVTGGLARLIDGQLPLADWVALVRATVPPRARWQRSRTFWERLRDRLVRLFSGARRAS